MTSTSEMEIPQIFYCYSRKDEELRNELDTQLSILRKQGKIKEWHDREITAGQEWQREIGAYLNTAHIILLLVSPDFIESDYCYGIEMKRAMERHDKGEARVIPIILRPIDFEGAPFSKLQALPKDGKAVTTWSNRDEAFADIAKNIRKVVEKVKVKPTDNLSDITLNDLEPNNKRTLVYPSVISARRLPPRRTSYRTVVEIEDFKRKNIFLIYIIKLLFYYFLGLFSLIIIFEILILLIPTIVLLQYYQSINDFIILPLEIYTLFYYLINTLIIISKNKTS